VGVGFRVLAAAAAVAAGRVGMEDVVRSVAERAVFVLCSVYRDLFGG